MSSETISDGFISRFAEYTVKAIKTRCSDSIFHNLILYYKMRYHIV